LIYSADLVIIPPRSSRTSDFIVKIFRVKMASLRSRSTEAAWAQIQYKQQIPDLCHKRMQEKMADLNEGRDTKTVTLYHMLHGEKRDEPQNLLYAPKIPRNFAAANKNTKPPSWYSLIVDQDLRVDFPKPSEKPDLDSDEEQEDNPDIDYMLEIRNGFSKKASCQDVKYLKLLHDLVLKVEGIEKQTLESQIRVDSASHNDEDGEDNPEISRLFTETAIAPLRHVLFEFVHYDWSHNKMSLYCTEHLQKRWLSIKAKSAPHHAYLLIQKLEEIAKLGVNNRLTIPATSTEILENEIFATRNIVHPLPHRFKGPPCKISYFVELWEVTDLATHYIETRIPDPSNFEFAEVIALLDRLWDAWFQDLSLLYQKHNLLFSDPHKQVVSQIASVKAIQAKAPTFCTLAVLPRWHGIPLQYAEIKEKWGITDVEAEDLDGHLHIAYDEILTKFQDGDVEMEDGN
jgi:hypothetical protein